MSESVADLAIRPSYEEIVAGIRHPGVREILAHAQENEQRLNRELGYIDADEDLNDEAKERKAQELIERYSPKISAAYQDAKQKVTASAETSYRFSLPFPEGKTFAQARATDSGELAKGSERRAMVEADLQRMVAEHEEQ
jgi:hypothetical protein